MSHGGEYGDAGIHTTSTVIGQSLCELCESQLETGWVESTEAWRSPLRYCLGRHPQLSQEHSWTDDPRLRDIWHLGWVLQYGRGLGSSRCQNQDATAAATTTAETAYGLVFQRRQMRLRAIHRWASLHHWRQQIHPIGIKQSCQIRWSRMIVRHTTSTMGLNGNLWMVTLYRQMLTMQIFEPQGELLP